MNMRLKILKTKVFVLHWRIKNRKWKYCRHKRKALKREMRRHGYDY